MRLTQGQIELLVRVAGTEDSGSFALDDTTIAIRELAEAIQAVIPLIESRLESGIRQLEIETSEPRSHERWTAAEEEHVWQLRMNGVALKAIAREVGRDFEAVEKRLARLALKDGDPRLKPRQGRQLDS